MASPARMRPDRLGVDRLAGERAVEIDDVKIFEPLRGERLRLSGGVGVEYGRPRHVAMDEPDALAVLEIDGRKENHGRQFEEIGDQRQAERLALLGMKLRAGDVVARDDSRHRAAVVGGRDDFA